MGGVNGAEEGAQSRDERIENYYQESAWDLAERIVDLEDAASAAVSVDDDRIAALNALEGDCVRLAEELDDARAANEELAGYARDAAHWEAVADRMRAEIERLNTRKCRRCNDSGVDPEFSYPAEGPSYYSMGEPEHLEPCVACQFPRPEEVERYRLAWLSARRRAAMESVYATEALATKDDEIQRVSADRAHLRKSWAAMSACLIKLGRHQDLSADDVKDIPGAHASYLQGHASNRRYVQRVATFVARVREIRSWTVVDGNHADRLRSVYGALDALDRQSTGGSDRTRPLHPPPSTP